MKYADQLKHPLWKEKRIEILKRDGFRCQDCSAIYKTLHVHHKWYESGKMAWEYENECLITLCEDCHEQEEYNLKDIEHTLFKNFRKMGMSAMDIMLLEWGVSNFLKNKSSSGFELGNFLTDLSKLSRDEFQDLKHSIKNG